MYYNSMGSKMETNQVLNPAQTIQSPIEGNFGINQQQQYSVSDVDFGVEPIVVICPFCRKTVTTNVEIRFSLSGIGVSFLTLGIKNIVNGCKKGGFCCSDAHHKCPGCLEFIAEYSFVSGKILNPKYLLKNQNQIY
jgi:hypothetical protein